jgi:hypothetical protein
MAATCCGSASNGTGLQHFEASVHAGTALAGRRAGTFDPRYCALGKPGDVLINRADDGSNLSPGQEPTSWQEGHSGLLSKRHESLSLTLPPAARIVGRNEQNHSSLRPESYNEPPETPGQGHRGRCGIRRIKRMEPRKLKRPCLGAFVLPALGARWMHDIRMVDPHCPPQSRPPNKAACRQVPTLSGAQDGPLLVHGAGRWDRPEGRQV